CPTTQCVCRAGRGRSSVGRAPQSHCGGQGFKSPRLHQSISMISSFGNERGTVRHDTEAVVPHQSETSGRTPTDATRLLVLPGDGIGPEIVAATVDVLREADRLFGLNLSYESAAIGFESLKA